MDSIGEWKKVHLRGKLLLKVSSALAYSVNYSVQQISNQRTAIRDVAKFTFSDPRAGIHWLLIVDIGLWSTASAVFPTERSRPCNQFSVVHLPACHTDSCRVEDVLLYAIWAVQEELIEHFSTAKTYSWRLILFFFRNKASRRILGQDYGNCKGTVPLQSVRESSRLAYVTP